MEEFTADVHDTIANQKKKPPTPGGKQKSRIPAELHIIRTGLTFNSKYIVL